MGVFELLVTRSATSQVRRTRAEFSARPSSHCRAQSAGKSRRSCLRQPAASSERRPSLRKRLSYASLSSGTRRSIRRSIDRSIDEVNDAANLGEFLARLKTELLPVSSRAAAMSPPAHEAIIRDSPRNGVSPERGTRFRARLNVIHAGNHVAGDERHFFGTRTDSVLALLPPRDELAARFKRIRPRETRAQIASSSRAKPHCELPRRHRRSAARARASEREISSRGSSRR